MAAFWKRFSDSEERKFQRLWTEAEASVKAEYGPLGEIGLAIITAAVECRDGSKNLIVAPTSKEALEFEVYVFFEYLYFFTYLTLKEAYSSAADRIIDRLQDYLRDLLPPVAVNSYFEHWTPDLKSRMASEFAEKLVVSAEEYEEFLHSANSIVEAYSQLFLLNASHIQMLCRRVVDIETEDFISEMTMKSWKQMQIREKLTLVPR